MNQTFFQKLSQLPDLLKSVLGHEETADLNVEMIDRHHLSGDQVSALLNLLQLVIMQILSPADLLMRVQQDLHLDPTRAKALTLDVLGLRLLPMEWYIGPVQPTITQLGGNPEMYLKRLRTIYPEVYSPKAPAELSETPTSSSHPTLLNNFEDRLTSFKGRAEVLLRLTGLSSELEEMMKDNQLASNDGQQLMQQLDAITYAVNTQDLNAFEVQSIKRRLTKILERIDRARG